MTIPPIRENIAQSSLNIERVRNQPQISSKPKIYQNSHVKMRLQKFCMDHCPNLTEKQMKEFICLGEELESLLADPNIKIEDLKDRANPKAAVALMWLLTAKAAQANKLFTSGSMRLAEGEKAGQFLKACGQGRVYGRISTHFQENVGKIGKFKADKPQWGFDLKNKGLPAEKHTILFALQPDGSLFVKLENKGVPSWTNWSNFKEWLGHALDYLKSRPFIAKLFNIREKGIKKRRHEHVQEVMKSLFKQTMQILFPSYSTRSSQLLSENLLEAQSFSGNDMSKRGELLYEEGKKYGISKMVDILEDIDSKDLTDEQAIERTRVLTKIKGHNPRPKAYLGDIKGNEVLIPPFRQYH